MNSYGVDVWLPLFIFGVITGQWVLIAVYWFIRWLTRPSCHDCGCELNKIDKFGKNDIYQCAICHTVYRQFKGEFFKVFGAPPATKGGNHESKYNC